MTTPSAPRHGASTDKIIADALRSRSERESSYREQALKLFPWVCGRCGRDFSGPRLRELTVHHRDHNHDNNPSDGSNWELLCLYCHDNEHARQLDSTGREDARGGEPSTKATHQPFADLAQRLKRRGT